MSKSYISQVIRDRVAETAKYRCGYCLTQALIVGTPMEIDHLIPESLEGSNDEDNLWLACGLCNSIKNKLVAAFDPLTGEVVSLFNPRTQIWHEHLTWSENNTKIIGLTNIGRATVFALKLNRPHLTMSRKLWTKWGVHPPQD